MREPLPGPPQGRLDADPASPPDGGEAPPPPPAFSEDKPVKLEIAKTFSEEDLDVEAVKVVRRFMEAGYEAYLVGGCVRDLLFGLRPKDFDVVTSAQPAEIRKLFRNCRIIGRRFRLAHVFFRDKIIEVATFRAAATATVEGSEGKEAPGELLIREDNVYGDAEEDARRRDFTVNALFYDVARHVIIDHVGGVADAERKLIRTIGDAGIRMQEDPIRMLRAVRLASRLGCRLDEQTQEATRRYAPDILRAATPRIHEDLLRMFSGGAMAPAFDMLLELGVMEVLLPELTAHLRRAEEGGQVEELEALRGCLRVADSWTQSGRQLSPAVRFALLLAPVLLTPLEDAGSRDAGALLNTALQPISQRLSISRKEGERIRQVLLALGRFVSRHKKRRFSVSAFIRRAYFGDALDLFELMTRATGDLREDAKRWRERYVEAFPDGPPKPKKRSPRRRRHGREHGEKGARTG